MDDKNYRDAIRAIEGPYPSIREAEALTSLAISMKRIADCLEWFVEDGKKEKLDSVSN